ncbi:MULTISPECIES: cysteine desulfurase family protein [unclassified Candidatus Frackibacter]|uniref:cysteine desulfurase family protein n=1 Tax=unclassified Candidatus Frackibacter TaxID=2648818 RepID=UPI000797F4F4|nr:MULTISPECIES: cysteine desulfurase family protein [unclassified Candidatus Frackibacter]KXS40024.1 MAG: cysteine desulfurase [Candidatus Frackibacter sp. T328-2]SDC58208.1 cysteine desulfurase [Candidatus Frackibacter sp. WG11]SEM72241.1 cysteine desulfurase [Candidatus Frackibacter sp. WG12]SFL81973.1 cysteine desulfurase [Candidatus Frackibacter sp. WG13]
MKEVYLDNSATTKPRKEVVEAMMEPLTNNYGNPSSLHQKGIDAEKLLKEARRKVAKVIRANEEEIIFTSGGTESNNLAIKGTVDTLKRYGNHLITTKVEHSSVLHPFQDLEQEGWKVTYLDVDENGILDLDHLREEISEDTILVSIMYVNSEVGAIQPIDEVEKIVREYKDSKLYLHVDAVQALDKIEIDLSNSIIDLLSMSGHKIHGPKGSGGLYVAKDTRLKSLITGGGQENGYRAGTENVPGFVGFGEAVKLATEDVEKNVAQMQELKTRLADGVISSLDEVQINGPELKNGAPHILNLSFRGLKGEVLVHALEEENIYVSTGSACSSKDSAPSHVLTAMGVDEDAMEGTLRFSLSTFNNEEEIDYTIEKLIKSVPQLRKISG